MVLKVLSCIMRIGYFTVVCLVAWPLFGNETGGDLVLKPNSPLFICKCKQLA